MKKKLLYGLGTVIAAATPVFAVVSCGSDSEENNNSSGGSSDGGNSNAGGGNSGSGNGGSSEAGGSNDLQVDEHGYPVFNINSTDVENVILDELIDLPDYYKREDALMDYLKKTQTNYADFAYEPHIGGNHGDDEAISIKLIDKNSTGDPMTFFSFLDTTKTIPTTDVHTALKLPNGKSTNDIDALKSAIADISVEAVPVSEASGHEVLSTEINDPTSTIWDDLFNIHYRYVSENLNPKIYTSFFAPGVSVASADDITPYHDSASSVALPTHAGLVKNGSFSTDPYLGVDLTKIIDQSGSDFSFKEGTTIVSSELSGQITSGKLQDQGTISFQATFHKAGTSSSVTYPSDGWYKDHSSTPLKMYYRSFPVSNWGGSVFGLTTDVTKADNYVPAVTTAGFSLNEKAKGWFKGNDIVIPTTKFSTEAEAKTALINALSSKSIDEIADDKKVLTNTPVADLPNTVFEDNKTYKVSSGEYASITFGSDTYVFKKFDNTEAYNLQRAWDLVAELLRKGYTTAYEVFQSLGEFPQDQDN